MSFWTNVRDTFTAPVRAIGGFVGNVFSGENVLKSSGEFASKSFAAAIGPTSLVYSSEPAKSVLNKLSPFTLGLSKDVSNVSDISKDLNTGGEYSTEKGRSLAISTGKLGAVAAGGYFGGAALGGGVLGYTGAAVGSSTVTNKLLSGDIQGAIESGASPFVPQGLKENFATGKSALQSFFGPGSSGGESSPSAFGEGGGSGGAGYSSGYQSVDGQETGNSILPMVALAGAAIFLIVKLRKKS